ncbi:MAG: hypothetical protein M3Q44_05930 [bacterium]|nr:hypothetical protein [bacterium]
MKKVYLSLTICVFLASCTTNNRVPLTSPLPSAQPRSEVFSASTSPIPPTETNPTETSEEDLIKQYLANNLKSAQNGKLYVAYEELHREEKEGMNEILIWALVQEISRQDGGIKRHEVISTQLSLIMQDQGDGMPIVTQHAINSIPSMTDSHKQIVDRLQKKIDIEAQQYFASGQ